MWRLPLWVVLFSGCFLEQSVAGPPAEPAVEAPVEDPVPPAPPAPPEMKVHEGVIGAGTDHATPWWELTGAERGPTMIVEAGIHGDEIAGVLALDALLPRLEVTRGRVVVFPRMNRPAVDAETRQINRDLNTVFPGNAKGEVYELRLAREIFDWVGEQQADLVLTLHESRYLHDGSTPRTFGQTIVYGVKPMPRILDRVLSQLNEELADPKHKFWPNYFPIATSSTEQFVDNFGGTGFCAETWRGFDLDVRVQMQEELVLAFFDQLGIGYRLKTTDHQMP